MAPVGAGAEITTFFSSVTVTMVAPAGIAPPEIERPTSDWTNLAVSEWTLAGSTVAFVPAVIEPSVKVRVVTGNAASARSTAACSFLTISLVFLKSAAPPVRLASCTGTSLSLMCSVNWISSVVITTGGSVGLGGVPASDFVGSTV